MRQKVLALGLVFALSCDVPARGPKPELPATSSWIRGQRVVVRGPAASADMLGDDSDDQVPRLFREALRHDLASAGALVFLDAQLQPGDLLVRIDVVTESTLIGSVGSAAYGNLMTLTSNPAPDCISHFASPDPRIANNMACWARVVAKQLLESAPVQAAVAALRKAQQAQAEKAAAEKAAEKAAAPEKTAAPANVAAPARTGKLAVLDLRTLTPELTRVNAQYFTDVVRSAVLKAAPALDVMTRENLLVLLRSTGRELADCEGECEVDTGRRIGADLIISGELSKLGTRFKLSLRLHDTRDGRLVSSSIASGNSVEQLDDAAADAVAKLFP
jgi:hypothetical protein